MTHFPFMDTWIRYGVTSEHFGIKTSSMSRYFPLSRLYLVKTLEIAERGRHNLF